MAKVELSDGCILWYELIGDGPILVLNHGYGSSHKSMQFVAEYLKKHFTCLLWDQRGQGDSDKPLYDSHKKNAELYTLKNMAEDCRELLEKLNIISKNDDEKIFMYGHSMGGMISLIYAIKYENTLQALAVGSTTPKNSDKQKLMQLKMVKMNPSIINEEYHRKDGPKGFTSEFIKNHSEFIEMKISDKLKIPNEVTISLLEDFVHRYNVIKGLKKLQIPVLIMHGKKDETIKFEEGEKLSKIIPNNRFIIFPDQNHEINKEIPEKVAEQIREYFLGVKI